MNEHIEEILRSLLSTVNVLNAELVRLARNEQLTDSLTAVRLLKNISEAYAAGSRVIREVTLPRHE